MTEQPSVERLITRIERGDIDGHLLDLEYQLHKIVFREHPRNLPHYLTSLEAALRLIPEWASFELQQSAAGHPTFTRCRLHDWRRSPRAFDPDNEWKSEGSRPLQVNVCLAALRAHQAYPQTDI